MRLTLRCGPVIQRFAPSFGPAPTVVVIGQLRLLLHAMRCIGIFRTKLPAKIFPRRACGAVFGIKVPDRFRAAPDFRCAKRFEFRDNRSERYDQKASFKFYGFHMLPLIDLLPSRSEPENCQRTPSFPGGSGWHPTCPHKRQWA